MERIDFDFKDLKVQLEELLIREFGKESILPKHSKVEISCTMRYARGKYQVDIEAEYKPRTAYESEILGSEIVDEDWDAILSHPTMFGITCKHENLEKMGSARSFLIMLRNASNNLRVSGYHKDIRLLNVLFKRSGLPYRIVNVRKPEWHYYLGKLY